jgi:hypothetical protein
VHGFINLVAGVKMPFPENRRNNRRNRSPPDTNAATVARLRPMTKSMVLRQYCPSARAEMLCIYRARRGLAGGPTLSL